ncbi:hypothetical protein IAG41_21405 [Sphingomonas sp. JC676]|uniref:hypothetical protein n=1 Tax=Sphingomonas sp. JC676 TaxID=2768065 RepID=UPI001657A2CD|nr:hypothetical protein [Sphingomonas sp. JC676]MBC9034957.1 hypothetical protein [Sphingomonas sp. JC676]
MKLSFAGVFADAGAIWRGERQLLTRIAGVFYVVPILGFVMLLGASGVMQSTPPEQMREALNRFYGDNLLAILLITAAMDFGTFAILNLFLQGGGRTLGEVLMLTLRRFLPFLAIDLLGNLAFAVGLSLFVLPGLFALARTWLAAPAYAARPEQGVIEAFRQGWTRSGGFVWLILLGVSGLTMLATLSAVVAVSAILGSLHVMTGGSQIVVAFSYLAIALIGGFAWTAVTVLRVAAYRLTEPR